MSSCENELACETNRGGYKLSIIAQFGDYGPVKYVIRIEKPQGDKADFVRGGSPSLSLALIKKRVYEERV